MNPASPISVVKAEPQDSVTQPALNPADPTETWLLVITGISSATFLANLICRSPQPHATSWIIIFIQSIFFLALTAAAGAAGIFAPWFFLKTKPSFPFRSLAKRVGLAWVFLPCITLLYRRHSPWMFAVLAITAIAVTFNIRRLVPTVASPSRAKVPLWQTGDLPSFYGLPGPDSRPLRSFFLALCLQGTLISSIAESFFLAAILLSISLFLLVWRWSAFDSTTTTKVANKRTSTLLYALAFFLTAFMLIPPSAGGAPGTSAPGRSPRNLPTFAHGPSAISPNDYVGVVLWPPPVKKQPLPPVPRPHSFSTRGPVKPLIIPFDGQYWYFKAPSIRPGPHAHIAHGKSTEVNVRSSDLAPLLMEAYQNLSSSIDLSCCGEIDVAITNADTRPGKISLGIVLTDSSSSEKPIQNFQFLNLGEQPIRSSESAQISMNRPPVDEVLHFLIPKASMRQFNEITIVFLPAKERARAGAKVSIQSFTLVPR